MTRIPIEQMDDVTKMNDHDLLITMHEQIKNVRLDIKELKDGTDIKLADHEVRLRRLELWGFVAVGALYAIQFWLTFIHK